MNETRNSEKHGVAKQDTSSQQSPLVQAPSIALPKGGGAIRGIGEKFAANPVTGTGSMTVPIATSPGRSGFGPQLTLSYDSGAGNGPFGFGWSLSLPAITRKTDKGLPQYQDNIDSDVFILSGAEDLVPMYRQDHAGGNAADHLLIHEDEIDGYLVRRYRPRIEGLFARIERWSKIDAPDDVHWRSISKDNILTLYGLDAESRVYDPLDPNCIFTWLICETRDDKGNAMLYRFKKENGTGIDLGRTHERNRGVQDDDRRMVNRYLKHIYYGNRTTQLDDTGQRPRFLTQTQIDNAEWLFEVVFDYGEHDAANPVPKDSGPWNYRPDPFSSYRSGFEVRTTRLCQRVLMFHHFPDELGNPDYLVRSTDFTYSYENDSDNSRNPIYSFLDSVTQTGYVRREDGTYFHKSLPPVEFVYSPVTVQESVKNIDSASLENLPIGADGSTYQWIDLHGEGIPGILSELASAWFYKRNISPISDRPVEFGPLELVAAKPNLALHSGAQFMDLAGDGQPDVVVMDGPMPGLYEHDEAEGWQSFRPFTSRLNQDTHDPNLKFVDLDGDGHADVFITEDDAFVWHASLAENGFGPARRVAQALDEEKGPRIVFADGTQSIYLADLSGDGLTDLARIRNGEVCYWPNLGYGRFGSKVTMDTSPWFDNPDQFDQKRIRLADIDGSGTTDIIYLHRDCVRLYFNQSGNSWSAAKEIRAFPRIDDLASIQVTDLLGNGTACLVWSSALPGDARRPMRYVNLMGDKKPHLLVSTKNNLGAETIVEYAPSIKFYLQDKRDGKPWITRLPFPVHVVERVETYDYISRNRFVTRYAYHHGYFDGVEREFRGFGRVDQWDTEEFAALSDSDAFPNATNIDAASHVPPVLTKTWFHTGAYSEGNKISLRMAHEYFGAPLETDPERKWQEFEATLLPDTIFPETRQTDGSWAPCPLAADEQREAVRALKGSILRQEVYAEDGSNKESLPYTVSERNYTIECFQPQQDNRHAVFFVHPRETIDYHYERKLDPEKGFDPRVTHNAVLQVDSFGNIEKSISIGYARKPAFADEPEQKIALLTLTENAFANRPDEQDWYRTGAPVETRTYEVTRIPRADESTVYVFEELDRLSLDAAPIDYEIKPDFTTVQKRLIEHVRTLYRHNNLTGPKALGDIDSLALPYESYKLAFTANLAKQIFITSNTNPRKPTETALEDLFREGGYMHWPGDEKSQADDQWWLPSGKTYLSPVAMPAPDTLIDDSSYAASHFFLPHVFQDPWGNLTRASYDAYDLLTVETRDALDNVVTVETVDDEGMRSRRVDYRVLQPYWITEPNGNRSRLAFDALGMVAVTAIMGKAMEPNGKQKGDMLEDQFVADLSEAAIDAFFENPLVEGSTLLGTATTRIVYDLDRFMTNGQPAFAATIVREMHEKDLAPGHQSKNQVSFSYSDGFGREIQKKIQAEPGSLVDAGPKIISPRWVGSGWTIFNNKGKPVRQYEPFFSKRDRGDGIYYSDHRFEFGVMVGVSPVLFYDPAERVIATLNPNHTWEKVVFDPWCQATWDVNDTVRFAPETDPDVGHLFSRLPDDDYLLTWYDQRKALPNGDPEKDAADIAAAHADTPTTVHFDTLGRPFLTMAHNGKDDEGKDLLYSTRTELDIEGNQLSVTDALGRKVMLYDYDMLGNRCHQASMEAGKRWILNDVAGKAILAWDSREHAFRTVYDPLRRPLRSFGVGIDPDHPGLELLTERLVYGEQHPEAEQRNLRGKLYLHLDQAGVAATEEYDFKANPLFTSRRLTNGTQYRKAVDWTAVDADHAALPTDAKTKLDPAALESVLAPRLESDTYTSSTTYDALNRPVTLTTPDKSVIRPSYNEANLLDKIKANLHGGADTHFITNIDYNAKGQRVLIDYGNGAWTTYSYDRDTFRLTDLETYRGKRATPPVDCAPVLEPHTCIDPPDTCPQLGQNRCVIQKLHYTYDPAGNITRIRDAAQQTIYFRNKRVEPSAGYTYDAIYRLIEATGREHLGQMGGTPIPHSYNDAPRVGIHWSANDGNAMGTYSERYLYDAVGNFLGMNHRGHDDARSGWKRTYSYVETSLIETEKYSNRLSSTTVGNGDPITEQYGYDAHGNMQRMPHLQVMQWDYKDQLQMTQRQKMNVKDTDGDLHHGERTYYVYDSAGQRVRKVTELPDGSLRKERIYLGGFEIYREHSGANKGLKRETLHIMDDKQRIALVEMRNDVDDGSPKELKRYQFGNHLGSANLELDEHAHIISYEEHTPYGSTSYQAFRRGLEANPRRFRYTGKERDEESGLYYHGARYYAPWLGRWVSCDPAELVDGLNLFTYTKLNPISNTDPTGGRTVGSEFVAGFSGEALGTLKGVVESHMGDIMLGGPVSPVVQARKALQTVTSLHSAYTKGGGGWGGISDAVDSLNPFSTLLKEGYEADNAAGQALSRLNSGDNEGAATSARESGSHYFRMCMAAVGLGSTAAGGIGFARSAGVPGTARPPVTPKPAPEPKPAATPAPKPSPSASVQQSATQSPPKDLRKAFMRNQTRALKALPKEDPVRNALLQPDGKKIRTGRGKDDSIGLEAGHLDAKLSGKTERLALQDADANARAGQTVESRNSPIDRQSGETLLSNHEAFEIRPGVHMEAGTLYQYVRLGVLPESVLNQAVSSMGWSWLSK